MSGMGEEDYAIRRMSRNGKQQPGRPRIEVMQSAASPEEAAAIAAAIEQFLRDTAPAPQDEGPSISPWGRAALYEAVGLDADAAPWGA
jgi:hypothetical protein